MGESYKVIKKGVTKQELSSDQEKKSNSFSKGSIETLSNDLKQFWDSVIRHINTTRYHQRGRSFLEHFRKNNITEEWSSRFWVFLAGGTPPNFSLKER